ncbi:cryptochrome/photolyase family protein [Euhalothece natronophila Z-M001]|uniref:Cryptochrome/photolyase family protein n=1 Tax=Euhalothece natronophila Z-M001 TaxID=522448 RepID=A0A5B8NHZ9_9CHRO|nr:cryptochrome/photolyase family protein [Euhalothece natronophila]QDZ38526.1 cryptochrome/photolyase family protein [Euhalothece natronophila Z-M001]
MVIGIWVLGTQLSQQQAALQSCQSEKAIVPVIMIESWELVTQRPYHQQKLVLIWSAMRHFAKTLQQAGWTVSYQIAHDFRTPLQNWVHDNQITELRVMRPSDRAFISWINQLDLSCEISLLPNNHFLWSTEEFQNWANPRKRILMEDFYRQGRKRFNVLMEANKPVGGNWNFDQENRKPPNQKLTPPSPLKFSPDEITQTVIKEVKSLPFNTYGNIEPFSWGVTREQAQQVLSHFISNNLANFGTYQDAMVSDQTTLWHSLLSPYLNLGLLHPWEVISAVEQAYWEQNFPLNSVEGIIRQILGWREFLNGIYHWVDLDYDQSNWFNHTYPLPDFFWDSNQTDLNCLKEVLKQIEETGYAHHIQRLMILSNFALIVGISPQQLKEWFHATFIDAYEWVMVTNVIGMGQFADGGVFASKPYVASANYINKMSNYCQNCRYNPRKRSQEEACPFNFFYWDFLARHRDQLKSLGRMNLVLGNLRKIDSEELAEMQNLAVEWRNQHESKLS